MIQNLRAYVQKSHTLEGVKQVLAMGPVASQEAIKQLGTNGGGLLQRQRRPSVREPERRSTNFLEMFAIFAISAGLTYTFGKMAGRPAAGLGAVRRDGAPLLRSAWPWPTGPRREQPGRSRGLAVDPAAGNMEGKEVRFGIADSALCATATTDASCGAVNAMHDSFTPLGGLVPLVNIQLGEVVFGGVGAGLYGMLVIASCSRSSSPA